MLFGPFENFLEYVFGRKFVLRTDHKPLTFMHSSKTAKCARWALELSEYQFEIEHVKGNDNILSDTLSRHAISDSEIDLPILAVTRSATQRQDIIERAHSLGHFSATSTLELAKMVDPTIHLSEVETFVSHCVHCLEGPHSVRKSPLGITKTASHPWEILHCDFVGRLPRTSAGYEYIFTIQDDLTRFVLAWPLRAATTVSTTTVLGRVFSLFGSPKELHCDNGSVFTSDVFKEYLSVWHVICHNTPVARPQANPVECYHRTLKASLMKCVEAECDWDKVLPQIVAAHNAVANRTTSIPPYYALFGHSSTIINLIDSEFSEGEEEPCMSEQQFYTATSMRDLFDNIAGDVVIKFLKRIGVYHKI